MRISDWSSDVCSSDLHRFLRIQPALHRVEQLVVADLARRRFMLDLRRGIADLDIGHRMRPAQRAQQQAVALGEVAHALGIRRYPHDPAIGVVRLARADPLAADGRSEEHTSELQSLMRTSYAFFCLKK